jgi:transmembrane sensor
VATAAAVVLAVGAAVVVGRVRESTPVRAPMVEYHAGRGQRTILQLGDGTQVTLAPGSVLRRAADYGVRSRRLELQGEGYFVVAHDVSRPFTVATGRVVARVLGTRFDVRGYAGESATTVVVAEGQVAVAALQTAGDTSSLVLTAGDAVSVRDGAITRVHGLSIEDALAWTRGTMVFRDMPLSEVATRISRWYDVDVRLADPRLGALRITGSFGDESVSDVLDAVARSLGLRLLRRDAAAATGAAVRYELSRK